MGGPAIPFATGRVDLPLDEAQARYGPSGCPFGDGAQGNPHGSRLPAADLGLALKCPRKAAASERERPTIEHIRATFDRLGMSDRETVALIILGHQFGRCHLEVGGSKKYEFCVHVPLFMARWQEF